MLYPLFKMKGYKCVNVENKTNTKGKMYSKQQQQQKKSRVKE